MGDTATPTPRFSIRLIHLNKGWRYLAIDRAEQFEFLQGDAGEDLDFSTEEEARAVIRARHGEKHAQEAVLRGRSAES